MILVNRKLDSSKKSSIKKCVKALKMKKDIIIYPEGVWNKSPNKLVLHLWPGIYKIAKEEDKNDIIHTVIDEPIDLTKFSEEEALIYLRDKLAY